MPTKVQVGPHRVFMWTELRQAVIDEVAQGYQSLLACHGPIEIIQLARMRSKVGVNKRDDVPSYGVRLVFNNFWHVLWTGFAKTFSIVRIEVPLATHRFIIGFAFNQHLVLLSHGAIKKLHSQAARGACPFAELRQAT